MPAKRVIILHRSATSDPVYTAVLWADVPAGNQIAYRNPSAISANTNATPAEVQLIRDGVIAEKVVTIQAAQIGASGGGLVAGVQTYFEGVWNTYQSEITAAVNWADSGRFWDNVAAWNASPGVPMVSAVENPIEGKPAFFALTPVSAFGANKFQFVLANFANPLGQSLIIKIRLVAILPGLAVVTGVASSAWSLRRRDGASTFPSGAGLFAPSRADSSMALPSGIGCYNAPAVSPAGGTLEVFGSFMPQADEIKLSTLDAATMAAISGSCGGQVIYDASRLSPARPVTVRAGEILEVQQSATGGTGNCQVLCVFTVG